MEDGYDFARFMGEHATTDRDVIRSALPEALRARGANVYVICDRLLDAGIVAHPRVVSELLREMVEAAEAKRSPFGFARSDETVAAAEARAMLGDPFRVRLGDRLRRDMAHVPNVADFARSAFRAMLELGLDSSRKIDAWLKAQVKP